MVRRFFTAATVSVALAVTGCQKSLCTEFQDVAASLKTKSEPCASLGAAFLTPVPTPAQIKACEDNQDSACSDADRTNAQAFADCLDKLTTCSPATAVQWSADYVACGGQLQTLSPSCTALFGL